MGNQMFQVMLAAELMRRVGGATVSGYDLPDWGLKARPGDKIVEPALVLRRHVFDLDETARRLASGAIATVVIEGWGMRLDYFGGPERYRKLFRSSVISPQLSDKDLLINIRAEDIADGRHPKYYPLPFSFYEKVVDLTGLRPVFMGQVGPGQYTDALRKRFSGAEFLPSSSPIRDFQTIRSAKHVVLGVSSFSWLAAWLSETTESIHLPIAGLFDPRNGETMLLPVEDCRYKFYDIDFPGMEQRKSIELVSWAEQSSHVEARSVENVTQLILECASSIATLQSSQISGSPNPGVSPHREGKQAGAAVHPAARPAFRRNPAPGLLWDSKLARNERLQQFLAFGFSLDHEKARSSADRFSQIKQQWRIDNPDAFDRNISVEDHAKLLVRTASAVFADNVNENLWLGLSAGLDSRFLLYVARKLGLGINTYTFGQPGYLDFDLSRYLSRELNLQTRFFDTSCIDWPSDLFDRITLHMNDKPVSWRQLAQSMVAGENGLNVHGYINDAITGSHHSYVSQDIDNWDSAAMYFTDANDTFKLQKAFKGEQIRSWLSDKELVDRSSLYYGQQLHLCYRQEQRIKPGNHGSVRFLTPFIDEKWLGFWLNRSSEALADQSLYLEILGTLKAEEFFDLNLLHEEGKSPSKENRAQLFYGLDDHAESPVSMIPPRNSNVHFCEYSCYRNNIGFKAFVDGSLARLRGREVFRPSAIDNVFQLFLAGRTAAASALNGLISADIAIEAGCFDE